MKDLIHAVCGVLREEVELRTGEAQPCKRCALQVHTEYGIGTPGCVLRARQLINLVLAPGRRTPLSNERLDLLQQSIREQMGTQEGPLIVAVSGGRDYDDLSCVEATLDFIDKTWGISLLVHGAARGADTLAGLWADRHQVNSGRVPAKWRASGKRAGRDRNRELATWHPHVWVFFPGGTGTAHAREVATEHRIKAIAIAA